MTRPLAWLAVLVALTGGGAAAARAGFDTVTVVAGLSDRELADALAKDARERGHKLVELPAHVFDLTAKVKAEIEAGNDAESGRQAPAHLNAFSDAVLAAIPDLFSYRRVRVISEQMLPLELVRRKEFLGDVSQIAHEFPLSVETSPAPRHDGKLPLQRYFIDAVMGMEPNLPRARQDIVQVALKLENEIPVDLSFGGGDAERLGGLLARKDVSILHIDTHGGSGGREIQLSRSGALISADEIPASVGVPVVLLFGCEGLASKGSFGAVLRARGAEVVISAVAPFDSYGLTGSPARERLVYEAFFSALRSGETVGKALVRFRQAAKRESRRAARGATVTRLLFVLAGRDDLRFAWPKARAP